MIFYIIYIGKVSFTDYPRESVATMEGGSLTFNCLPIFRGERLSATWYLSGGSTETVIISNKTLSGGTMATVGSDYRSPLTLSNINRVWNGTAVHCAVNPISIINQPGPYPVISVWCELLAIKCIRLESACLRNNYLVIDLAYSFVF